ncbi:MAG: hypothetical protein RLZZ416_799 [Candidatus Parcubacteria bacterium]|jgi:acyl-CoA synthetase (AMP-forming)/AMP-acid ligase II
MANLGNLIDPEKDPEKVAVIDEESSVTYRKLHHMSNYVAFDLQSRGYKPGDRIGLFGYNTIGYVAAYLGILKSGGVAVLINVKLPKTQIEYIAGDSGVKFLYEDPRVPDDVVCNFDAYDAHETDPAIIMYTSGSTSAPKGVVLPHKHKWILEQKSRNPAASRRRVIVAAPLYHMNGLSSAEATILGHGTLVLLKKFDPITFLKSIRYHRVNSITSVPTMLTMLLREKELLRTLNLDCVTHVKMASAPVSKNLFNALKTVFPKARIQNTYGVTEVSPGMFGRHPSLPTPDLSVGYPVSGIDYRIVDGILQVRSPSMFLKYSNVDRNNVTEDGYFITNDRFRVDEDGFYFFLGRADNMFVSGGNNVYPEQIESILEKHPLVESAIVVGLEDEIKGIKPYAFVLSSSNESDLKQYVLDFLPPSHCPRRIWVLDSMPLNAVNKIDRALLKEKALHEINR